MTNQKHRIVDRMILQALHTSVTSRSGHQPILDVALDKALGDGSATTTIRSPTGSLSDARALLRRRLPSFWITSGLCSLSGHASIGPDYNGPDGQRLEKDWPPALFHEGFHADLAPGDDPTQENRAVLSCLIQAELARIEFEIGGGVDAALARRCIALSESLGDDAPPDLDNALGELAAILEAPDRRQVADSQGLFLSATCRLAALHFQGGQRRLIEDAAAAVEARDPPVRRDAAARP